MTPVRAESSIRDGSAGLGHCHRELGILKDVYQGGAQDIYCVESEDGKTHLIPAVASFVASVDPERKIVRVRLIEGLWNV